LNEAVKSKKKLEQELSAKERELKDALTDNQAMNTKLAKANQDLEKQRQKANQAEAMSTMLAADLTAASNRILALETALKIEAPPAKEPEVAVAQVEPVKKSSQPEPELQGQEGN
jgi:chromosome segregation ATPase